jgi:hypothetical protein
MVSIKKTAAAGALVFFLMLCSCGEFDSVFPISQTYQVSATAGDHSLDEYSGIGLNDEIQPFFVHAISGDQDIRGLVVSLQTPDGKPAGQTIRYSIGEPEEEDEDEEEDGSEVLIRIAGTDRKLPPFRMGEDLETGPYRMVFEILGEKEKIFSKTEKSVFYLAGADYGISEISAYLPGYSPDSYLIAPGTLIMLEARVIAGEGLDPYVVWYDGKKQIGEGRISAGGNRFFFTVPEENGFRLLRAETFPFPPVEKRDPGNSAPEETARGKIRELSLPVSVKGTQPKYFVSSETENFAGHYLFAGDLQDSLDPYSGRALIHGNEDGDSPSWLGYGGIYGLAVGAQDCYLIPQEIFEFLGQHEGKKIFSFRCKLFKDGTVFSAPLANGLGDIQLSRERENLVLTLNIEGNSSKVETALPPTEDFTVFSLSLDFRGDSPAAVLSPEWMPGTETSLNLTGISGGAAVYRLGIPAFDKTENKTENKTEEEAEEEKALLESEEEGQDLTELPVLILDELAVTAKEE